MFLDNRAILSDAQAITATAPSTNVYDLGEVGVVAFNKQPLQRNIGRAGKVPFLCQVVETFDELTSLTIAFQTAPLDTFLANVVTHFQVVVPAAELVEGYILPVDKIPRSLKNRYFRLLYTVTGTAPTEGKITAGIVAAVDGSY